METILVVFVLIFLGFVLGTWISAAFHRSIMREFLKEMGYDSPEKLRALHDKIAARIEDQQLEEATGKPVIKVRLEQHQGVIFAYREDDSTFIGQGNTREDLIASIMHRIKGATIEIVNGELLRNNNA
jgi:ferritin-like protein